MMEILLDHYGQELNLGDMVLGAQGGGRYKETRFLHAVVVGRTKKMIRLHQIHAKDNREQVLRRLKARGSKRGGKVFPEELIRLQESFITRDEIDKHHDVKLDPRGVVLPKALQSKRTLSQSF